MVGIGGGIKVDGEVATGMMGMPLSFPAVVYFANQEGQKADKEGLTSNDRKFADGKMDYGYYDGAAVCSVIMFEDHVYISQFGRNEQWGVRLIPGVTIPVIKKEQLPRPLFQFDYRSVRDFNVMPGSGDPGLAVKLFLRYAIFKAVAASTFNGGDQNYSLIRACDARYKELGMTPVRRLLLPAYIAPFADWMNAKFQDLEKVGVIKRNPANALKVCPKHRKVGIYAAQYKRFFCPDCNAYID